MVIIEQDKCRGCGQCAADCVARNIDIMDKKAVVKQECLQCGHCVAVCPFNAVSIPEYDMEDVEACRNSEFRLDPKQFLNCVKQRRSIRDYQPQKVSEENLKLLAEAGRYTATANNSQSNGFVFVQNEIETLKAMVWNYIDKMEKSADPIVNADMKAYKSFYERKKANPEDDYLFRNAPVVLFITSDRVLDAGMAAQNMELMAVSLGMGAMFNGFLMRIADENMELKKWLGVEGKTIRACMLLGYSNKHYVKSAPRKKAEIIIK